MPTYTYRCPSCDDVTDGFYTLKETRPDQIKCKSCGEEAQYELASPVVLKASFLDGQRKGWKDLKEASKLNKLAAATDNISTKEEIRKEQSRIGYNFNKDTV